MAEAHGFVDGDLVEVFVDLPRAQQEEVVAILQARALCCVVFFVWYFCLYICKVKRASVLFCMRLCVYVYLPYFPLHKQADGITGSSSTTASAAGAAATSSDAMDEDKKAAAGGQGQGQGQGPPLTVEEVYRRVEEMARLH